MFHVEFGRKIKDCLRNPESFSTQFRHYVLKKKFRTFELPSLGLKDILVIPKPDSKPVSISYNCDCIRIKNQQHGILHALFKQGARRPNAPGFLKLLLSTKSVCVSACVCVCVSPPPRL